MSFELFIDDLKKKVDVLEQDYEWIKNNLRVEKVSNKTPISTPSLPLWLLKK